MRRVRLALDALRPGGPKGAALAVAVVLTLAPIVARADLIYVLNSGDASVSVIDSHSRAEIRRIPVLREPHHLLMAPDGRELMVADSAANEMLYVNPDTAEVIRRERISNPYHLGYSPDNKYLVVNSLRRGQVDIYNAADMQLLARVATPTQPSHMAFSPDSKRVFVTLQGTRSLVAIDLDERRALWTIEVGPQPAGIIWHNDRLLIGIMGADYVAVVNPAEARVERQIVTARGSHTVWPSPDGKIIYATSRVDSAITLLDAETLEVKGRWDMPGGPDDLAWAPDGKLWVTLRWIARVAVVDTATGQYETIRVGRSPHGLLVHPTPPSQPVASAEPMAGAQPVAAPAGGVAVAPGARVAPAVGVLTPPVRGIVAPAHVPEATGKPRVDVEPTDAPSSVALQAPGLLSTVYAADTLAPAPPPGVAAVQPLLLAPYRPWWRHLAWR